MKLLIHAPNVHQGGGRTLLLALLEAARHRGDITAVIDARLPVPSGLPASCIVARVAPGVTDRLSAEWRLRNALTASDRLLCFGNLPPLLGTPARAALFLQNRYVVGRPSTSGLPLRTRLRMELERLWLRARLGCIDTVVVQTPSMAREVERELGVRAVIAPFGAGDLVSGQPPVEARAPGAEEGDFLYVASGEPHKNHRNLVAAWKQLADEGIKPSLRFTVSCTDFPDLCREIDAARSRFGLRIDNVGAVDPPRLEELYARSSAIIYPSRFESFGLPLLEAAARQLPILAAELDYVRDVVDPVETFDPESPVSIARAVKRFLGRSEAPIPIMTPDQFLDRVLAELERVR